MKLDVTSYWETRTSTMRQQTNKVEQRLAPVHFSDCAFLFSVRAGKKRRARLADEWRCSRVTYEVASLYFETVHLRVDDFPPTPSGCLLLTEKVQADFSTGAGNIPPAAIFRNVVLRESLAFFIARRAY
jgi:hypothetical protein